MIDNETLPREVTPTNYTEKLHAELVIEETRIASRLSEVRGMIRQAENRAVNGGFPLANGNPMTVVLGDRAVTLKRKSSREGWDYVISAVVV